MTEVKAEVNRRPASLGSMTALLIISAFLLLPLQGVAQVFASGVCNVSVLNQTAFVRPDGSWILPNVPSNMGTVRARINCIGDGTTRSGASEFFTIERNRMNAIPPIPLGAAPPTPEVLAITAPTTRLTSPGETLQLRVTAVFTDASAADVTSDQAGTVYATTNARIATVSPDGLVTGRASGRVLVTALHEAILAAVAINVVVSGDSDGDGLPDDLELEVGLDPNTPLDALADFDSDGLTNRQELLDFGTDLRDRDTDDDGLLDGEEVNTVGTNPALFDTDGDGLSDGLEVQTGSDPLDPTSFNLATALVAFEVTPSQLNLVADVILPEASRQLTVTGTLLDTTTIDLTPRARGTQYASSDLLVCNFGAEDGVVFAGNDGTCTVTASNSGFSDSATITVSTFAPTARAVLSLPGFANNVDVAGDRAFVAAGSAGLLVIDVGVRTAPRIAASLALPGNANDVKVRDGLAYVAAGAAGLRIVDVTDPEIPVLRGFLDTPGDARDVALAGNVALVADGGSGVQIVDVGDPGSPALLGAFDTPGAGKGVDVSDDGRLAVVADGAAGLQVLDVTDPASPLLRGSVATADARDVDVVGATAWVADFTGGLTSVDLSDPASPRILASVPREFGGIPMDVVVTAATGPFALVADVFFVNGVPIVEVSDPANPLPRTPLDFSATDDFNGTGLAVDENFVYLTASKQIVENGSSGETRLYVGQYLGFEDDGGVAPSVRLVSPLPDTPVPEGSSIRLEAEATDDVGVFVVRLLADGEVILEDDNPPYVIALTAPPAPAVLTLSAVALDFAGNRGEAEPVAVQVVGRETTSVVGSVVDGEATPVEGAAVFTQQGRRGLTEAAGFFRLDEVPADEGELVVFAAGERDGEALRGRSGALAPVAGGLTDAGEIVVAPLGAYPGRRYLLSPDKRGSANPSTLATGDFDGDGRLDVAAWSSDRGNRITVLYHDGGGELAPAVELATAVVPSRVAAADLNGDGLSDLVALNRLSDDLSVFLARAGGGFAPERRFAAGDEPWGVAVGDLNRDAVPDLAVLNQLSSDVTVLLGLGGGEYLPGPSLAAGALPAAIVAADLDADGVSDLAVAGQSQAGVMVYFGRGDGTLEPAASVALPVRPIHMAAADVNLDGHLDLVFLGLAPTSSSARLVVLPGLGDRTFAAPLEAFLVSTVAKALAMALADVDRDGFPDAVISAEDSSRRPFVKTLRGDGSGFFTWQNDFETYTGRYTVLDLADVDGDGFVDLLTGSSGGVTVFRGGSPDGFVSYRRTGLRGLFVVGDLNLDGLQDLLVQQGTQSNILQAYLGRPDGGFDTPPSVSENHAAHQLLLADVDRDGLPDAVALANASFAEAEVAVYLGRGDGTFAAGVGRPIPVAIRGVLADFNGDGFLDLATTRSLIDEIDIFINQGGAAFSAPTSFAVGVDPSELAVADFDGNGGLDLVVVNAGSSDLSILLNRGDGVFEAELRASAGPFLARLGVLDADRDGRPDLVVRDSFPEEIAVLLGNGDGTFRAGQRLSAGSQVDALVIADVDLDGIDDVVAMNRLTQDVSVYRGRGDGILESEKRYLAGGDVLLAAVADIDHDGQPDLVVFASEIHLLLRK